MSNEEKAHIVYLDQLKVKMSLWIAVSSISSLVLIIASVVWSASYVVNGIRKDINDTKKDVTVIRDRQSEHEVRIRELETYTYRQKR